MVTYAQVRHPSQLIIDQEAQELSQLLLVFGQQSLLGRMMAASLVCRIRLPASQLLLYIYETQPAAAQELVQSVVRLQGVQLSEAVH